MIVGYIVRNRNTGKSFAYLSSRQAITACDRMDNAYGGYCCSRRAIWSDDQAGCEEFSALRRN